MPSPYNLQTLRRPSHTVAPHTVTLQFAHQLQQQTARTHGAMGRRRGALPAGDFHSGRGTMDGGSCCSLWQQHCDQGNTQRVFGLLSGVCDDAECSRRNAGRAVKRHSARRLTTSTAVRIPPPVRGVLQAIVDCDAAVAPEKYTGACTWRPVSSSWQCAFYAAMMHCAARCNSAQATRWSCFVTRPNGCLSTGSRNGPQTTTLSRAWCAASVQLKQLSRNHAALINNSSFK